MKKFFMFVAAMVALMTLSVYASDKTPITYATNSSTSYRLGIVNGGSLTITGTTTLVGESKIRVCEGGILIVDGGILQNADITMVPGSKLIVRNNHYRPVKVD